MLTNSRECLKWSQKEAGSLPQSEVECPSPNFFIFIFDLTSSHDSTAITVLCYASREPRNSYTKLVYNDFNPQQYCNYVAPQTT